MAAGWGTAASEDVAICTADLATRLDMRAQHVTDADTHCIAHDAHSVSELAALTDSPPIV